MPWAKSFCPFRACCFKELLPLQGVLPTFSLRAASSLSFGRRDKAAESGDVDYDYHQIIKGLYTLLSRCIDPCRFPMRCGKSHCIKYLCHTLFLFSSKRQHITYLLEISNPNSFPKRYYQTLS